MTKTDRRRGCLLGLAVGDALGAPVEFEPVGSFDAVTGYRAGGPHGLEPGEWTDDTSMALALADSIAECAWDLNDQAQRYLDWWRGGEYTSNGRVFDIGITTVRSLQRFAETGDARTSGAREELSSGNGSVMRLAPVPIAYHRCFPEQLELLLERAEESSMPTHASAQCLSGCRYLALLLAGLIHGIDREQVLAPDWAPLQRLRADAPLHPEVDAVASGTFRRREPPEIHASTYVVRTLEAALWAFHEAPDFAAAVLAAVNLGDDADTVGAVCGQLSGACWGERGIPGRWLSELAERERIEEILVGLVR